MEPSQRKLSVRQDLIAPICMKLNTDVNFRQLILKTYRIAVDKSYFESPETSLSEAMRDLLPNNLQALDLNHDEILQVIMTALFVDAISKKTEVKVHPEFLFEDPGDAEYWIHKARLLEDENSLINALRCYDKALKINTTHPAALAFKGCLLLRICNIFMSAVNPIWPDLTNLRAIPQGALECFESQIKGDPDDAYAWYNKGVCLIELGRANADSAMVEQAAACFERCLSITSEVKDARRALGDCRKGSSYVYGRTPSPHMMDANLGRLQDQAVEFLRTLSRRVGDYPPVSAAVFRKQYAQARKENPIFRDFPANLQIPLDDSGQLSDVKMVADTIRSSIIGESAQRINQQLAFGELRLKIANASCGTPAQYCHAFWDRCGPICQKREYGDLPSCPCSTCTRWDGSIIVLHTGIRRLIHIVVESFLGCVHMKTAYTSGDEVAHFSPQISQDEAARTIHDVVNRVRNGGDPSAPPKVVFKDGRFHFLGHISSYAHLFIIAHEMAHFLLSHGRKHAITTNSARSTDVESFAWSKTQEQEFEADQIGFALVLNINGWGMGHDVALMLAVAGAEVVFYIFQMCERIGRNPPSMKHPPASDRVLRLREKYQLPDRYYEISNTITTIGNDILSEIVKKYNL